MTTDQTTQQAPTFQQAVDVATILDLTVKDKALAYTTAFANLGRALHRMKHIQIQLADDDGLPRCGRFTFHDGEIVITDDPTQPQIVLRPYQLLGYPSMKQYFQDPLTGIKPSTGYAALGLIELSESAFEIEDYITRRNERDGTRIPVNLVDRIGSGAAAIVNPILSEIKKDAAKNTGITDYHRGRAVEELMVAESLSLRDFDNYRQERQGWLIIADWEPHTVAELRGMTRQELLEALVPLDLPADGVLVFKTKLAPIEEGADAEE